LKNHIVLFVASLTSSFISYGLGLGELKINSYLNQPFAGEIELIDVGALPLTSIKTSIAAPEEFAKLGIERSYALDSLQLNIERNKRGRSIIHIQSTKRIDEPYIQILVDLAWPDGQVYRAYTILLDPPDYKLLVKKRTILKQASTNSMSETEGDSSSRSQTSTNNTQSHGELTYGPTLENESIWQVAQRYKSDNETLQQIILAIVGRNPASFVQGNLNGLKPGKQLIIPSSATIQAVPEKLARGEVLEQDSAWQGRRTIQHIIQPPYTVNEDKQSAGESEYPAISILLPVPNFNRRPATTLPSPNESSIPIKTLNPVNTEVENFQLQKARAEIAIASTAIESVRETNLLLSEQVKILQTENKRLMEELSKRDRQLSLLRKEVLTIKQRQAVVGQTTSENTSPHDSLWSWLLLLLLLPPLVGALYYWWYFIRSRPIVLEDEILQNEENAAPSNLSPLITITSAGNQKAPASYAGISTNEVQKATSPPEEHKNDEIVNESLAPQSEEIKLSAHSFPEVESNEELEVIDSFQDNLVAIEDSKATDEHILEFEPGLTSFPEEEKASPQLQNKDDEESHLMKFYTQPVEKEEAKEEEKIKPAKSFKALQTLLDLAKTYISMNDFEAAKQSLEEVLEDGDTSQKKDAQKMLEEFDRKK
jgi:pilus assembly protein FimV